MDDFFTDSWVLPLNPHIPAATSIQFGFGADIIKHLIRVRNVQTGAIQCRWVTAVSADNQFNYAVDSPWSEIPKPTVQDADGNLSGHLVSCSLMRRS